MYPVVNPPRQGELVSRLEAVEGDAVSDEGSTPSFGGGGASTRPSRVSIVAPLAITPAGDPPSAPPSVPPTPPPELTPEQEKEQNRLLHFWCVRQLHSYLKKLVRCEQAAPFREPIPWEQLGLTDYLEVVENPIDLRTIGERLSSGGYEDEDGFVAPQDFWDDVALCWDNCMDYYADEDEEIEAFKMAEKMRSIAETWEEHFFQELEDFEQTLNAMQDSYLRSAATFGDVAARTVEDVAVEAYDEGSAVAREVMDRIMLWWSGGRKKSKTPEKPPLNITLAARQPLKVLFHEIILSHYDVDVTDDLDGIEAEVQEESEEFNVRWRSLRDGEAEEDDGLAYEGAQHKLPIAQLVSQKELAETRWTTVRNRMLDGHASSRRSSPGSSRESRTASPAISEVSGVNAPPLARGRSRRSASSSTPPSAHSSRPASLREQRLRAPVASNAAAIASLLPTEASEESDKAADTMALDMKTLKQLMPKRAAKTPPRTPPSEPATSEPGLIEF